MSNNEPLVSIGMPVYNGDKYMQETLDSLLAQDYGNLELIISDNASTDRTQEICLSYKTQDKRIKYYRSEINKGSFWNFNRVFELSSGEYFMWAAHDDYWEPSFISSCLKMFQTSNKAVSAGTMCKVLNSETGELIIIDEGLETKGLNHSERLKRWILKSHHPTCLGANFCGVFNRSALSKVMPWKKMVGNDHILLAELSLLGEFGIFPESLMIKRQGGASSTYKSSSYSMGITNKLFFKYVFLIKEIMLQKIIFKTDKLSVMEKVRLSFFSFRQYLNRYFVYELIQTIPLWLKTLLKHLYNRVR